ncbi:MAG: MaoC family dehydratase N-terminal domain-containing protein [Pseudomonadota bacterium]
MSETHVDYRDWIGRSELRTDQVTPVPVAAMAATLDCAEPPCRIGDELPPLWHWLYFLPVHRLSKMGADGHPQRGGFLPPISQPRRMWAGSRLSFLQPLHIGDTLSRTTRIANVIAKRGRSGALVFLSLRHEIGNQAGPALVEEQDLVYRDAPQAGDALPAPLPGPPDADWADEIQPDPVLLFRYSALSFNSHRIHYDQPYATDVEGYPGLVVHGPLLATLLLERLRRHMPRRAVRAFEFRALRPVFHTAPFFVCGRVERPDGGSVALWVRDAGGALCMEASARVKRR